jgi:hypothetical protein
MIVYKSNKRQFLLDVYDANIEDIIAENIYKKLYKRVGDNEFQSWSNSLPQMELILRDDEIPEDAGIAIEYNIPRTQNRIDFIVSGQNENGEDSLLLIELKQWSSADLTAMDAIIKTNLGGAVVETLHPSYQAWSYAMLLNGFNVAVYNGDIKLYPCAYLHNYKSGGDLDHPFYEEHLDNAPLFGKDEKRDFRNFIKQFIKYGDRNDIILKVENGELRPSKILAESLSSLVKGNKEFTLIDTQKEVFEKAKALAKSSKNGNKNVLIVEGGPGTGKSVVAINLLVDYTKGGMISQYVTRNSAPRAVYESKLTGTWKKTEFSNFFTGSGSFVNTKPNSFDALIIDEAHRLNEKSGLYQNIGENQIKEIIRSSLFSIFFIDEDQKIHIKDIGTKKEIVSWAKELGASVQIMELTSQFRCSGSDGYLAWLDNTLQIRDTANILLNREDFDFQVFDNPIDLRNKILQLNKERNSARMVAGYCWDWKSKKNSELVDIVLPEYGFEAKWNLSTDGMLWLVKPETVSEVGCIHTCQGLELEYIGVIIGEDMICRRGEVLVDPTKRSGMDQSIKGYKKMMSIDPKRTKETIRAIIKNTYRTLMTRGMKGCYVYCVDNELEDLFKSRLAD